MSCLLKTILHLLYLSKILVPSSFTILKPGLSFSYILQTLTLPSLTLHLPAHTFSLFSSRTDCFLLTLCYISVSPPHLFIPRWSAFCCPTQHFFTYMLRIQLCLSFFHNSSTVSNDYTSVTMSVCLPKLVIQASLL